MKTELVKILDSEYKDGELSKSLVYDRLAKTIVPQLEEDFHLDIYVFKNNKKVQAVEAFDVEFILPLLLE